MPYNPVQLFFDAVIVLFFLALVVPDRHAIWIVKRRNLPTWAMLLAVAAFVIAIFILGSGLFYHLSVHPMGVEPWVWICLIGGIVLTIILVIIRRRIPAENHNDRIV